MTHPKRFRDMSLTAEDAADIAQAYWRPDFAEVDGAWDCFVDRCMRLLPLWRQWGLRNCRAAGYSAGYDSGRECGPDEECV